MSNNVNVDNVDKDFLLQWLDNIEKERAYTKNDGSRVLSLLRKYEPIINGFGTLTNAIILLQSVIK